MFDIIIIGAGTAGMTAALYALRAGASVMLLESDTIGGQISFTPKVENYPGIMQISGTEFSSNLFDQIEKLGVAYDICKAEHIEISEKHKTVWADGKPYLCKSVIIAGGVKPRKLGIAREEELFGEGVCYCAVCDGAFYKGRPVAVCGGGNSALTDALFLSAYCSKVTLIHRRDSFNAEKTLVDRIVTKSNVEILFETTITELIGSPSLTALSVTNASGQTRVIESEALFVAAGHIPDNGAFSDVVVLDKNGFILAGDDCKTSAAGIFAAGDCRTKHLRQLTTAVADGATAGLAAVQYADSLK